MQADKLKVHVKVVIAQEDTERKTQAFGQGVARLCDQVFTLGSLNKAAKKLGIAYSKAWRMIHECEETMGVTLIVSDGARGSKLTLEALKLLETYKRIEGDLDGQANEVLQQAIIDYRI